MTHGRISHIIFDLSEVLLTGIKDTGLALAEKHLLEVPAEHTLPHASGKTPLLTPLVEEFFKGTIDEDAYLAEVVRIYPQIGNEAELKELIREGFQEIEGTREIVLKLKRLGYPLGLLSVHAHDWIAYCEEKYDYHAMFDECVYSCEIGISKPDPRAFRAILDRFNVLATQCLFIDDSRRNIEAASALGFETILFTDAPSLHRDLRKILPNYK